MFLKHYFGYNVLDVVSKTFLRCWTAALPNCNQNITLWKCSLFAWVNAGWSQAVIINVNWIELIKLSRSDFAKTKCSNILVRLMLRSMYCFSPIKM